MKKNIKDYREKELKSFVIGNILLILLETGLIHEIVSPMQADNIWMAISKLFTSSVLSSILYIFVFIFDSIISGECKDKIVWMHKNLPGRRIFTEIRENSKDSRFTSEDAKIAYADVYQRIDNEKDTKKKADIQNDKWYQLYQKYEDEAQVSTVHRDYLLCRDMSLMMIWILVGYFVLSWYLRQVLSWKLMLTFLVEFIIIWIAARIKGERFVYNVIAKDLADKKNKK